MCLDNISLDFSTINATKTGLNGSVYDFAVDYVPINGFKTIYDIHRYLTKKNNIVSNVWFDKKSDNDAISISIKFVSLTNTKKCLALKDQKCSVKKVIVDNEYITFPYKIKVEICIGSCNNITNPYSIVCIPDIVK